MNKSTTTTKQADIRYRVQLKNHPHIVVYKVMSSNGVDMYDVTLVHGKVSSCGCPSKKPCYHWTSVQAREDARAAEQITEAQPVKSEPRRNYAPLNGNKGFSLMR